MVQGSVSCHRIPKAVSLGAIRAFHQLCGNLLSTSMTLPRTRRLGTRLEILAAKSILRFALPGLPSQLQLQVVIYELIVPEASGIKRRAAEMVF